MRIASDTTVSADRVWKRFDEIFDHPIFKKGRAPARMKKILRYLLEEELAGRGADENTVLSALAIYNAVFEKPGGTQRKEKKEETDKTANVREGIDLLKRKLKELDEHDAKTGYQADVIITVITQDGGGYRAIYSCGKKPMIDTHLKDVVTSSAILDTHVLVDRRKDQHRFQEALSPGMHNIVPWKEDNLYQFLSGAKEGSEVKILTTLFIDGKKIRDLILNELIPRKINVKILMPEPDKKELFKAGSERLLSYPDLSEPQKLLTAQLATFEKLSTRLNTEGSLEVRKSSNMPFGFFVQCGSEMRVGLLLPLSPYQPVPVVEVKEDSWLGKLLDENWQGYWAYRSEAELIDIEGNTNIEQVWLATPDLTNDMGERAQFREVVQRNVARGVKYTIIFPKRKITAKQLEDFWKLFPLDQAIAGIRVIPIEDAEFAQFIPRRTSTSHIVVFHAKPECNQPVELYMEDPTEPLWRKLEGNEAQTTLEKFMAIIQPDAVS